jgi:hypothetical protein
MVIKHLSNKKKRYEDYTLGQLTVEAERFFTIKDHGSLKSGKREMFYITTQ